MSANDEIGWLIEHRPGCTWWDGRSPETFTPDPNDCVRFARKEDAERVLTNVIAEHNRAACIVTEHLWCAPPETCEGCDEPATKRDVEGVPLCQECFDACVRESRGLE